MTLIERCRCGASVEVRYSSPNAYPRDPQDRNDALQAVNTWRELHKACRVAPDDPRERTCPSCGGNGCDECEHTGAVSLRVRFWVEEGER